MSLYAKLAEVMGEVGRIEKKGRNPHHGYSYAKEEDIVEAVREKLASRKVMMLPSLTGITEREYTYTTSKGEEKTSVITTARVKFEFLDGESEERYACEWAGQGDDPADKGLYAAYTGAVKYFITKGFLIPTGDDPEANPGSDERSQQRSRPSKPPSEKQAEYLHNLVKRNIKDTRQLVQMLREAGSDTEVSEGWAQRISDRQASMLIERLKNGEFPAPPDPAPVPESDVPSDPSGFVHPPEGRSLEDLVLEQEKAS
jgi:ERF superfamily